MFPWRRRNEGFEWREYVRTTILLKRSDRRRRIEEAKLSAIGAVKEASLEGASRVGEGMHGLGRRLGVFFGWIAALPGRLWGLARPALAPYASRAAGTASRGAYRLGVLLQPAFSFLTRREIRLPLMIIGVIAAIGAVQRQLLHGYDQEVAFAGIIAAVSLLFTAVPFFSLGGRLRLAQRARDVLEGVGFSAQRLPGLGRMSALASGATVAALAALLGLGGLWAAMGPAEHDFELPQSAAAVLPVPPANALEGKAVAVTGDSLRFNGALLRLSGIEAPEREQTCERTGASRWRCGEAARTALDRLIRGRRVVCNAAGSAVPPSSAECTVQGEDIAASLVREGHVFAIPGHVTRYVNLEQEARSAKAGLWAGEAERPQAFRAKKWEEAKRLAPEGCPIKGQVSGKGRIYHLPWSASYQRVKVREGRGERWFCSEEEARAAGWKATARS